MSDGLKRRDFIKVLGAGGAGATLSACAPGDVERLIPYVVAPEDITPGVATWYHTVCGECAAGCGIRVKTREGRAIMIEGNPDHPASEGAVCSRGISALQGLYDPDRISKPMLRGADGSFQAITWEEAQSALASRLGEGGRSLLMTSPTGPAENRILDAFAGVVGADRLVYDSLDDTALREATRIAYGVSTVPRYDMASASVIVSFGADFLETWGSPVEYGNAFSRAHGIADGPKARFIFVGSRLSLTGQNADEWVPIEPGTEATIALALAGIFASRGADAGPYRDLLAAHSIADAAAVAGVDASALEALADRLMSDGPSVILGPGLAGSHRGATAANLAILVLNHVAGNVGQTVHIEPTEDVPASYGDMVQAVAGMSSGAYDVAMVAGPNPAYSLPSGVGFAEAFQAVPFKVVISTGMSETAAMADLVLPASHALESWGDADHTGAYSVRQPAMRPLPMYESRSLADIALQVAGRMGQPLAPSDFKTYLHDESAAWYIENGFTGDFEAQWRELLRTGVSTFDEPSNAVTALQSPGTAISFELPQMEGAGELTLLVYPSARFGDGSHANRPWLQELPDPVTKMTWHSVVEMHPTTVESLGLRSGDVVRVTSDSGMVEAPLWPYPGMREGLVALSMGGGHTDFGRFANGNGVNAIDLLPALAEQPSGAFALISTKVSVEATGDWKRMATTEGSSTQEDRGVVPAVALSALGHAVEEAGGHGDHQELQGAGGFVPVPTEGRAEDFPPAGGERGSYIGDHPRWAMALDLDKCTGCGACVIACQAENNIPWVGEDQIAMGREMHWMRIERYYETVDASHAGPLDVRFLPMLCQHCNNAPCEPVCPVFATYHTFDGLNAQVYNRCVGTRYCANNCPYKLRVYNWYSYTDLVPEPMTWQWNPDVTVRENGIMEKCSFCVQRIRAAGNQASLEGRDIQDGDVQVACQSVCGADVIVFGDIKDPNSRVSQVVENERSYRVLDALINTQPAVTYLKKVTFHDVESGEH